jgi:hypothetical protein
MSGFVDFFPNFISIINFLYCCWVLVWIRDPSHPIWFFNGIFFHIQANFKRENLKMNCVSIIKSWKRMLKIAKGQSWGCHLHRLQCPTTNFWSRLDGDQISITRYCTLSMRPGPNPTHCIFQLPCGQGSTTKNQSQPTPRAIKNQSQLKLGAIKLLQFPYLACKQIWRILVASLHNIGKN